MGCVFGRREVVGAYIWSHSMLVAVAVVCILFQVVDGLWRSGPLVNSSIISVAE